MKTSELYDATFVTKSSGKEIARPAITAGRAREIFKAANANMNDAQKGK